MKIIGETVDIESACKCLGKCLCEEGSPQGDVRMRPGEELIDLWCNEEVMQNQECEMRKKNCGDVHGDVWNRGFGCEDTLAKQG